MAAQAKPLKLKTTAGSGAGPVRPGVRPDWLKSATKLGRDGAAGITCEICEMPGHSAEDCAEAPAPKPTVEDKAPAADSAAGKPVLDPRRRSRDGRPRTPREEGGDKAADHPAEGGERSSRRHQAHEEGQREERRSSEPGRNEGRSSRRHRTPEGEEGRRPSRTTPDGEGSRGERLPLEEKVDPPVAFGSLDDPGAGQAGEGGGGKVVCQHVLELEPSDLSIPGGGAGRQRGEKESAGPPSGYAECLGDEPPRGAGAAERQATWAVELEVGDLRDSTTGLPRDAGLLPPHKPPPAPSAPAGPPRYVATGARPLSPRRAELEEEARAKKDRRAAEAAAAAAAAAHAAGRHPNGLVEAYDAVVPGEAGGDETIPIYVEPGAVPAVRNALYQLQPGGQPGPPPPVVDKGPEEVPLDDLLDPLPGGELPRVAISRLEEENAALHSEVAALSKQLRDEEAAHRRELAAARAQTVEATRAHEKQLVGVRESALRQTKAREEAEAQLSKTRSILMDERLAAQAASGLAESSLDIERKRVAELEAQLGELQSAAVDTQARGADELGMVWEELERHQERVRAAEAELAAVREAAARETGQARAAEVEAGRRADAAEARAEQAEVKMEEGLLMKKAADRRAAEAEASERKLLALIKEREAAASQRARKEETREEAEARAAEASRRVAAAQSVLVAGSGGEAVEMSAEAARERRAAEKALRAAAEAERRALEAADAAMRRATSRAGEAEAGEVEAALSGAPAHLRALGLAFRACISASPGAEAAGGAGAGGSAALVASLRKALGAQYRMHVDPGVLEAARGGQGEEYLSALRATEPHPNVSALAGRAHTVVVALEEGTLACPRCAEEVRAAVAAHRRLLLVCAPDLPYPEGTEGLLGAEGAAAVRAAWEGRLEVGGGGWGAEGIVRDVRAHLGLPDPLLHTLPPSVTRALKSGGNRAPDLAGLNSPALPALKLDLQGAGAGAGAMAVLREALPRNTTLQRLSLAGCDAAAAEELAGILEGSCAGGGMVAPQLQTVEIHVELPAGPLRRDEVTELDLSSRGMRGEDALLLARLLRVNHSLVKLDVGGNPLMRRAGAAALAAAVRVHPRLASVGGVPVGEVEGAGARSEAAQLDMTSRGGGLLGAMLLADWLAAAPGGRPRARGVQALLLAGNEFGPEGVQSLADALGGAGAGAGTGAGADGEEAGHGVQRLLIADNRMGPGGGRAISSVLKGVVALDVGLNNLGDEGARALAAGLRGSDVIRVVSLVNNSVGAEGARALAVALKDCPAVEELHMQGNFVGDKGAAALAALLQPPCPLRALHLQENYSIGSEGARAIAAALQGSRHLVTLDLGKNNLGPDGAKHVAQALRVNTSLRVLGLEWCKLRAEGAAHIAGALALNHFLASLNLSRNGIGDKGAAALAPALAENSGLARLELRHNNIGPEGAKPLLAALRDKNRALRELDAGDNKHLGEMVAALAAMAQSQRGGGAGGKKARKGAGGEGRDAEAAAAAGGAGKEGEEGEEEGFRLSYTQSSTEAEAHFQF